MKNIDPIWLRYGILYGIATILLLIIFYYVMPISLIKQSLISFAIIIIFMVLAGKAKRSINDGYLSYGDALKTTFLTGLSGMVISSLFSIILMNLIDPGLVERLTEQTLEMTRSLMESFGMPEEDIENTISASEEKFSEAFTPINQILRIFQSAIFTVILAAIVSLFLKKDQDINTVSNHNY